MISNRRYDNSNRDLLKEISEIISAHDMRIRILNGNRESPRYDNWEWSQSESITLKDIENVPKNKKRYQRSPLCRDYESMPTISDNSSDYLDSDPISSDPDDYISNETKRLRNYKNDNEIAQHCQKILKITAYPTVAQITVLVHEISRTDSTNSQELDLIRRKSLQWFRKRREYLALKVYNVCDELMESVWDAVVARTHQQNLTYEGTVEEIVADDLLMETIFEASKLPIKDKRNGISFVRRKVKDFFNKLCTKTIQNY